MKRFYKDVSTAKDDAGFVVLLDGKPIRTPGRALMAMPVPALALPVAAEWAAQGETILPDAMPLTRLVTTSIDLMPARRDDALAEVLGYAETDLLCYRAAGPDSLLQRQSTLWQPWLVWAERELGVRLLVTHSALPQMQPQLAVEQLTACVTAIDDWRLVGVHAAVTLTGSLILGLGVLQGALDAQAAGDLALLDEVFMAERWGMDPEVAKRHARLRRDLNAAEIYLAALGRRPN